MNMSAMDHATMVHTSSPMVSLSTVASSQPALPVDHSSMAGMDHSKMAGMDHSSMSADEHAGHGSPDDMLRRFLVSLALTIPIIIFSPIGGAIGLTGMPPFGISMGVFGFALATPVGPDDQVILLPAMAGGST